MTEHHDSNILKFTGNQPTPPRESGQATDASTDVLALLRNSLADSVPSDPREEDASASSPRSMVIYGDGNKQAGRDMHVYEERRAPRLVEHIECPACRSQIPPLAALCWNCQNDVAKHFELLRVERLRTQATVLAGGIFVIFLGALAVSQTSLFPGEWRTTAGLVAGVAAFAGMVIIGRTP